MNKLMKRSSLFLMAMMLLAPSLSFAHADPVPSISVEAHDKHVNKDKFHQMLKVHKEKYLLLLAEKYTPDDVAAWQQVLKKRAEMWEHKKKHKVDKKQPKKNKKYAKHMETYERFTAAIKKDDAGAIREALQSLLKHYEEMNKKRSEN